MGSWNVYCQISKISISWGDNVVLVPIKANTYIEKNKYHFICPPIYGVYNDYGGIEDIEKNSVTKILEEYYGEDIDTICEAITRELYRSNDVDYESEILRNEIGEIKYFWVLRNIWDEFTKLHQNSWSYQQYELGNPNLLKFLGFEFIREDKSIERFNKVWKFGEHEFYSDDTWIHSDKSHSIFYIKDLEEYGVNVDELKGKSKLNFVKTLFRDKLQPKFYNLYEKLIEKNIGNIEELNKLQYEYDINFVEKAKHSQTYEFFAPFMEDYRPTKLMSIFHNYIMKNDDLDDEIIKLYHFRENCYNCSLPIEPMKETFAQFGEHSIHRHFTQIFLKELDKKLKNVEE